MKIYADEIPKSCSQCVCCDTDKWCNAFSVYTENPETKKNCPLKSLTEHDKEKRNELIDEIIEIINSDILLEITLKEECEDVSIGKTCHNYAINVLSELKEDLGNLLKRYNNG